MSTETTWILLFAGILSIMPVTILAATVLTLLGWSHRRRQDTAWKPNRFFLGLTWLLFISSGLILLGIGTCTGNLIIHGLRF